MINIDKNTIRNNWPLILVLILALAARLSYFFIFNPPLTWSDAKMYDILAWNLAQGNGYSLDGLTPSAFIEPGYMLFFIAPFYFIFGHNIIPVQIFQTILSIASVFIIYLIGYKFFDKKIGLTAAFLWAIWPAEIAFSQEILTEIPFTFLMLLLTYLLLIALKHNSIKILFVASLVLGLITITRILPVFLPFALLPTFYLIYKYNPDFNYGYIWKKSLLYFSITLAGIILFLTPWTIRNYIHFKAFYLGRPTVGVGLLVGSYVPWEGTSLNGQIPLDLTKIAPITDNKFYAKHAFVYIKENWFNVLKLWSKKPYKIFLKSVTYGQAAHNPELAKFLSMSPVIDILIRRGLQFTHLAIMLLGFIGLLYLFRKKEMFVSLIFTAIITYFIAIYLPFTPDARYQIPLIPYIIILASIGFWHLFDKVRNPSVSKNYQNS